MVGCLPEELTVNETAYKIRTDYRNVLQIFEVLNDKDLENADKWIVAVYLLFYNFESTDAVVEAVKSGFDFKEAVNQIIWFINAGKQNKKTDKREKPSYSWQQDEQMIFSAVNKVANKEIREVDYMHWWTFLGYFNEVGEGTFSFVVGIRNKINRGKNLEKHEKEFYSRNKEIVDIKQPLSEEELEQEREFSALLDEVIG